MSEEDMIKIAMEQSIKEHDTKSTIDETIMKTILAMSQNDSIDTSQMSPAISFAI
jgi:hypothetical protein